jgi:micrococcal nuclease
MERVRLTGFDAPELFSPECAGEYAQAVAATWHLRRLLAGGEVLTVRHGRLDRYDRRLLRWRCR